MGRPEMTREKDAESNLGFEKEFHEPSLRVGMRLMQKIKSAAPTAVIADCLSCRRQFQRMLPYRFSILWR